MIEETEQPVPVPILVVGDLAIVDVCEDIALRGSGTAPFVEWLEEISGHGSMLSSSTCRYDEFAHGATS